MHLSACGMHYCLHYTAESKHAIGRVPSLTNRKIFPFYLYSCANETVTEKNVGLAMWTTLYQVVCCSYAGIIASHFVQNDEAPNNYVCTVSYLLNSVHAVSYIFIGFSFKYKNLKC